MAETRSVRVRISGFVQGVGYRAWAERRATALGLSGWVRNCDDGDVEAVFSGSAEAVETMLDACQEGPRHSSVESVKVLEPAEPVFGPFRVRY